MNGLRRLAGYYLPILPHRSVYMLQQVEYDPRKYLTWIIKLPDLFKVKRRGQLVLTRKAQALFGLALFVYLSMYSLALILLIYLPLSGLAIVILTPFVVVLSLCLIVWFGNKMLYLIRRPLLAKASQKLKAHKAVKIAVLGSYGKTTMKELLVTVLGEAKTVKATPGNMNVPISHARWITSRIGQDEEVLIFEYGEGEPGDIVRFARLTHPDRAVVTGLAPNHLDRYSSLAALAEDLLSIRQFVNDKDLLLNQAAQKLHLAAPEVPTYSESGVGEWKIKNVKVTYEGTAFQLLKDEIKIDLHSQLLGRHQVGPLAAAAVLAYDLGLTPAQIQAGISKTKPFEHRMQARSLHGAWIIDDTYNGNLEGIRAGLRLLQDLEAKRKIYVTPGLVDQGVETENVHLEIGRLIAEAKPDRVVLMKNSVTSFIEKGLETGSYAGEVHIEEDPLSFYTNLEHTLAASDLLIMQNDWTDNYL